MADYFPPTENLPTFDVTAFRTTNDNNITQDDADRMYLSRQGVASSLATSTNFLGTVSCGGNLTLNAPTAANRQIQYDGILHTIFTKTTHTGGTETTIQCHSLS